METATEAQEEEAMTGILAIDPGASSGYCLIHTGSPVKYDWGVIRLKSKRAAQKMRDLFGKAILVGVDVVVIEGPYPVRIPKRNKDGEVEETVLGWRTMYGLGVSRGRWEQEAAAAGLRIVEVSPRTWQARTVGTGKRDQQIAKYKARAKHLTKSTKAVPADAAAAICIADWAMIQRRNGAL